MSVPQSFRSKTIYQVYPKSFRDSTGNGVGDLRGVLEKVPYIASLGVDMVWFNPFFVSPQRDNGYDIADYYAIDPKMGTMEDFDELASALAAHGIGIMLDMVLNHTSTEHEWFQRAWDGDLTYRDYYYVRPGGEDGSLPNNWVSKFGGPAWARFGDHVDPETGRPLYYLHLFDVTQADLNWHNPEVRRQMAKVVDYWHAKGVKGFRFDVINLIGKPTDLPSAPEGTDDRAMYTDGEMVSPWLQELAATSYGRDPETVTVGEMSSTSIGKCIEYTNPDNRALSMAFNFHHLKVDYASDRKWTLAPFDFAALKLLFAEWGQGMEAGGGWNALFWNNHDQPRALDRFGDPLRYHAESATMLATAIHLLRGTPFVYQGEEIGMTDPAYTSIDDYVDVEAINAYQELLDEGTSPERAFAIVHAKARDNSRTPMQWSDGSGAGFTSGTPWLKPTNQDRINVAVEEAGGRILPYYRRLIELRKSHPIIAEGTFAPYEPGHPSVMAYLRRLGEQRLLVVCNFYGEPTSIDIPSQFVGADVLISNYPHAIAAAEMELAPYQATALLA
ncbi:alpha,alpha-phosphotrehalase [Tessaracoccus caeni]|uniref:alpha,alpha-phosphotrehalase n=1 Tax=Tessaracoccus caeni TaxID=3031239 RepID=UPI0023DA6B58|nr:alpha,alpha-phosphotrehalase [Tessaracoccus caeni]MDF1487685.1 alpha,alpha-phosphotrehalase [Tessaracoccus caeni]